MATWPANNDTDWNTKMLAYLAIGHTTGGYHKYLVNAVATEVRTKYFTGNLDADASTSVAHGITDALTKILTIEVSCFDDTNSVWISPGTLSYGEAQGYRVSTNATHVNITAVGANFQGHAYRIKIDYIL
ncbi:MAG: hypothetical protein KAS32_10785 [Candidatus Peribacteraceae bacterium]|nr:hypothetical protein [Candidatus Peribacteraceae bacterium]